MSKKQTTLFKFGFHATEGRSVCVWLHRQKIVISAVKFKRPLRNLYYIYNSFQLFSSTFKKIVHLGNAALTARELREFMHYIFYKQPVYKQPVLSS